MSDPDVTNSSGDVEMGDQAAKISPVQTMDDLMNNFFKAIGATAEAPDPPVPLPPPKQTLEQQVAATEEDNKKLCELIKEAEKTATAIASMPLVPTACVDGGLKPCSSEFFTKAIDLMKRNALLINKHRCELKTLEYQQANIQAAVRECASKVKAAKQKCENENCSCAKKPSCKYSTSSCSSGYCSVKTVVKKKKKKATVCTKSKPKKYKKKSIHAHSMPSPYYGGGYTGPSAMWM